MMTVFRCNSRHWRVTQLHATTSRKLLHSAANVTLLLRLLLLLLHCCYSASA